ncbi:MAG: threonine aldolase family protein, partial [Candidatus Acidiferrales bacterium]
MSKSNSATDKPAAVVDLRSDTVTKPTAAMRRAMAEADVGDDVYGEDPTVNRLQQRAAEIFGREAALFVPTGSMGNLVAIKTWTQPGQEVICDERAHINQYELSSMSFVAGCLPRTTHAPDGILTWGRIEPLLHIRAPHKADTGLIALENTHNVAGGS